MKKLLSMLLALALVLGALPMAMADDADSSIRYKEPITLTWMIGESQDYPFADNEALAKVFAVIAEKTNVTVKWVGVPSTDFDSVYQTTLISDQKDWPNLVSNQLGYINGAGEDGAFVELDAIMQEKMPNVYADMGESAAWSTMVDLTDSHIYGIPRTHQMQNGRSWMIRQDWLEACGLEEPTTLDEFANCLRVFKEKNPGNAPADMNYPFSARGGVVNFVSNSYGSFGMRTVYYTPDETGYYHLNMTMPEWFECLKWWHGLYEEGLIDPAVVIGDGDHWLSYMNNSYSGATIDFSVRAPQITNALRNPSEDAVKAGVKALPDATLIGLVPLSKEKDGFAYIAGNNPIHDYYSVGIMTSCSNEQIDAACCLLNYIWSDEGRKLLSWGIDGVAYDGLDENGQPKWKQEVVDNYSLTTLSKLGIQPPIARPLTEAEDNFTYSGVAADAKAKNIGHYEPLHPAMYMTEEGWAEQGTLYTDIANFYIQVTAEFLTGARPLTDEGWEQLQKELKETYKVDRFEELTTQAFRDAASIIDSISK